MMYLYSIVGFGFGRFWFLVSLCLCLSFVRTRIIADRELPCHLFHAVDRPSLDRHSVVTCLVLLWCAHDGHGGAWFGPADASFKSGCGTA